MALQYFTGFECGDFSCAYSTSGGTLSVQSTNANTDLYAMQVSTGTAGTGYATFCGYQSGGGILTATGNSTVYTTFYWRATTLPASNGQGAIIFAVTPSQRFEVSIVNIGGTYYIQVWGFDSSGNPVNITGSTSPNSVTTGTWYKFEIKVGSTTTQNGNISYEVKLDGTSQHSGTMASYSTGNNTYIKLGKTRSSGSGGTNGALTAQWDDLQIEDSTWPSDGVVSVCSPNGSGSSANWTFGTNASNYQEVDEAPPDADTTYIAGGTGDHLMACEDCSTVNITGLVRAINVWSNGRNTGSGNWVARFATGGTNYDSTNSGGTTSYARVGRIDVQNPQASRAWYQSDIDSLEIGVNHSSGGTVRVTQIGVEVLYDTSESDADPGGGGGTTSQVLLT